MRRAPLVVGATAAGLVAVLTFHTKSSPINIATVNSRPNKQSSSSSVAASSPPLSSSGKGQSSGAAGTSGKRTSSSSTATAAGTRTASGPSINYFYGVLSVHVEATGTHITSVSIASLNDGGNFRSQSIDQQSIPILEQEAIQAQSANIQGVSGATYTSTGFQQSLQGALKKLGI